MYSYHFLKLFADIADFTSHGRLFQMAAPEYIHDLRKSSQFGFGMYRSRGSSISAVKF